MRADGKRLKNTDPMYTVVPYIMDKRNDALNMIELDIPVEPIKKYINKKRNEGIEMNHMSVIIAAYLRTVAQYSEINRFIVNKKIFARNEFNVSMVVLKEGGEFGDETMSKVNFNYEDTIFDVQSKIDKFVSENRKTAGENKTDKIIKALLSIPGILPIGVGAFKFLDNHGLLPRSIVEASPFHASLCITNLASIRTKHIYHHIYNFGTTSQFLSLGKIERVVVPGGNKTVKFKNVIPIGVVTDERVCNGAEYAQAFATMKTYLSNPALLEVPPEKINWDIDFTERNKKRRAKDQAKAEKRAAKAAAKEAAKPSAEA